MRAKGTQNNTHRRSPGLFSPTAPRIVALWNHIHPTSSRSAVMADLLRRVGKMLAMRPMTIIPLRRGPPPFTIALVRMIRMDKTAQTWKRTNKCPKNNPIERSRKLRKKWFVFLNNWNFSILKGWEPACEDVPGCLLILNGEKILLYKKPF